ncbi:hypothetical protein EBB07_10985 [Paenibacillaceae bacterium]|nr:hypothetical protein EBB07_10985 [Paenibacillaceae bacterium]
MSIEITNKGIAIDGEVMPLYSGAIHYWRLERALWSGILDKVVELGFRIVETYLPWSIHEIEAGKYDFGTINERHDIDYFLQLCKEKGLKVLVRPGPHINAEMTNFGYPERILYDADIQAKSPWGTPVIYPYLTKPFPIPSYASEKLYAEVQPYFEALQPILLKHQHPHGGIIGIQADNETCYFFRDRPYVMDYSDDSIALYRQWLSVRYEQIASLNAAYRTKYASFDEVKAPDGFKGGSPSDLPYYLDWVEYKEYQISHALSRLTGMMKGLGIDVPVFHNVAFQYYTPSDLIQLETRQQLDLVGIDMYAETWEASMLKEKVKYLSGSSILPFVPEFGSGSWFDRQTVLLPEEGEFTTAYVFMHGLKAVNYYMLVERERWVGCPITRHQTERSEYFTFFKKWNKFLDEQQFWNFERKPEVLVMKNFDVGRYKAAFSTMDLNFMLSNVFVNGPEFPAVLFKPTTDLGFQHIDDDFSHWGRERWVEKVGELLEKAHVDFNYSDQHLSLAEMKKYQVIFASTYDFMDAAEQQKLLDYAAEGGTVIVGPGIPYLDMKMQPCNPLGKLLGEQGGYRQVGQGKIALLADLQQWPTLELELQPPFVLDNPNLEYTLHTDGERELLFIANISKERETGQLSFSGARTFAGKWNAQDLSGADSVAVNLPAYTVAIWEVEQK